MLDTFDSKLGQSVYMTELYDYLGLTKEKYSRFVKREILESVYFEMNKDYLPKVASKGLSNKRGQFRQEIILHIDCAKKICMVSKSAKGNEIRNELVQITKKIESRDIITVEQAKIVHEFVNYYRFIENQKLTKDDLLTMIQDRLRRSNPKLTKNQLNQYSQSERNKLLNTSRDQIFNEYLEFCVSNGFNPKPDLSITKMTYKFDKYLLIYYAVIDFLLTKGYTKPEKIADFIYEVAKKWEIEILPVNESNLFELKCPNSKGELNKMVTENKLIAIE